MQYKLNRDKLPFVSKTQIPWKKFKNCDVYYTDENGGEFCIKLGKFIPSYHSGYFEYEYNGNSGKISCDYLRDGKIESIINQPSSTIKKNGAIITFENPVFNGTLLNISSMVGTNIAFSNNEFPKPVIKKLESYNKKTRQLCFMHNGNNLYTPYACIHDGKLDSFIKTINNSTNYKFKRGDIVSQRNGNSFSVLKQIPIFNGTNYEKGYLVSCNNCECTSTVTERQLAPCCNCSICEGLDVRTGINDIASTDKEMVKWLANKKDAKKYTQSSHKVIEFVCPICNHKFTRKICTVHFNRIKCPICSVRTSHPEQVVFLFLKQCTGVKILDTNHVFKEWGENKFKYDIYAEVKTNNQLTKFIIEVQGPQHFTGVSFYKESLKDIIENDRQKKELALQNGFTDETYIYVDAENSTNEYLKNSILNNLKLNNLIVFDNQDIDWKSVFKNAENSSVKEVIKLYKKGHSIKELAQEFKKSQTTIRRYLKRCNINN